MHVPIIYEGSVAHRRKEEMQQAEEQNSSGHVCLHEPSIFQRFLQFKGNKKDNLENAAHFPPSVLLPAGRQYSLHAPFHSLLSPSLVVFCVME